jgi:septal ring factor EnvC (AmiA/AmiB activator)
MGIPKELSVAIEQIYCCNDHCDAMIIIPERVMNRFRESHKTFHCYFGHPQSFTGKNEKQKLRDELEKSERLRERARKEKEWVQQDLKNERNSNRALKGVITRTKNRVKNGVCPCCNRSFKNLHEHMSKQHPKYGDNE